MYRQTGKQDVAPDGFVFQQFGDEPAEAEGFLLGIKAGDGFVVVGTDGGFFGNEEEFGEESITGFADRHRFRSLASGAEEEDLFGRGLDDEQGGERGYRRLGFF